MLLLIQAVTISRDALSDWPVAPSVDLPSHSAVSQKATTKQLLYDNNNNQEEEEEEEEEQQQQQQHQQQQQEKNKIIILCKHKMTRRLKGLTFHPISSVSQVTT